MSTLNNNYSSLDARYSTLVNASDAAFGLVRNETQGNAAINAVKTAGGGRVLFRRFQGSWSLGRNIANDQKSGGLLINSPNIQLESDSASFNLTDNCDFVSVGSVLASPIVMTGDITASDTTIQVASSASFLVSNTVFLRIGQSAYDAVEPDFWLWAKVTAIPDGTHITIDRPVGKSLTVNAVSNNANKSVTSLLSNVENVTVNGSWRFINPMTGNANAEAGISVVNARNVRLGTIISTSPGAGALLTQFVDGLTADEIVVTSSHAQAGQASKGRGVGFAETRSVDIKVISISDFEREAVLAEGRSEAIHIGTLLVQNTYNSRNNDVTPLISTLGASKVDIDVLHVTGNGSYIHDVGGTIGNDLSIQDAYFYTSTRPKFQDLSVVKRRLFVNGVLYSRTRRFTKRISLSKNMATTFALPSGYFRKVRAFASSITGLTGVYMGTTSNQNADLTQAFTVGQTVDLSQGRGFGDGYNASSDVSKQLIFYTDSTVVTGSYIDFEFDMFIDPSTYDVDPIPLPIPTIQELGIDAALAGKLDVPTGGTVGQALVKQSDGTYKPATVGSSGSNSGQGAQLANFGHNFTIGNTGYATSTTTLASYITNISALGHLPFLFVFHIAYDSSGVLRIVQFGFNGLSPMSESYVDSTIAQLLSLGLTMDAVKVHPKITSTDLTNHSSTFWDDYQNLLVYLASKFQSANVPVPYFYVTNEFPLTTSVAGYQSNLQSCISAVKAKGFKVGMSFSNGNEALACTVLDDLDIYGINTYPAVGTKGLATMPSEVATAFDRWGTYEATKALHRMYPSKQIFITETGCTDQPHALEGPAASTSESGYGNGSIMSIFWAGAFQSLIPLQSQWARIYGWDYLTGYSPYQYPASMAVMAANVKAGV